MSVFRIAKHTQNFSIIDNTGANDPKLTPKAKGVLWYLLTLPDYWEIRIEELQTHFNGGMAVIKSAMKELVEQRYIIKSRFRDEKGRYQTDYIVFEQPQTKTPENRGKSSTVENRPWTRTPDNGESQKNKMPPQSKNHRGKSTVEQQYRSRTNEVRTNKKTHDKFQNLKNVSDAEIWKAVLSGVEERIGRSHFNTWLKPTQLLSRKNGCWTLGVPDDVFEYWIQDNYLVVLQEEVNAQVNERPEFTFEIIPDEE